MPEKGDLCSVGGGQLLIDHALAVQTMRAAFFTSIGDQRVNNAVCRSRMRELRNLEAKKVARS